MRRYFPDEAPPKRQRISDNDSQEALGYRRQINTMPNIRPSISTLFTTTYDLPPNNTETVGTRTEFVPANASQPPTSMISSDPLHLFSNFTPLTSNAIENSGSFINCYNSSAVSLPLHASTLSTYMPERAISRDAAPPSTAVKEMRASNSILEEGKKLQTPGASALVTVDPRETVCFGVFGEIFGQCEKPPCAKMSAAIEVTIISPESFIIKSNFKIQGHIASDHYFVLRDILDSGVELHVTCSFESKNRGKSKAAAKSELCACKLDISLYAPFAMWQEIKEWSEHNEIFLQDPRFCLKDALYCNPQRLSSHSNSPRLVSDVISIQESQPLLRLRSITSDEDFLEKYLGSNVSLQEAQQPSAVKTALKRHQKQALTFMLRRESGWALQGPEADIWSIVDNANGRFYVNAVSESGRKEPPLPFHGGVIADPMGLGKTLTIIALVATDLAMATLYSENLQQCGVDDRKPSVLATLIVVPPPLLSAWEGQLSEHVFPGALKFMRHHAKPRITSLDDIQSVDVVLTTYHTISSEWTEKGSLPSTIFSVKWKRIVLDEAHIIRNEASRMSKAMCALDATCRWAVTGTPIQNHLNDLATLLKFIRAYPYDSKRQFEFDISDYWKENKAKEAATRLQRLSSCLLLRRPKTTVQLPPRRNKEYPVDFTRQERVEYDLLKNRATTAIEEALQQGPGWHRSGAYANILHQIESLRLFCGLGLHYHSRHEKGSLASHIPESWAAIAQRTFKTQLEMGTIECSQCHATIDLTQAVLENSMTGLPLFSQCLRLACAECATNLGRRGITMPCGHRPACPVAQVSTSLGALDDFSDEQAPSPRSPTQMPSKIMALISDIRSQPSQVKSVVFSTWRLTLNVAAAGLKQAGIESLRFDGSIPQKDRFKVLENFKTDPSKRVLLLTLSCGAVGLTLTEASRAYLMEPHWNPTIEEQALGRIHRIGQNKEVTTVRLFVRDSFETHVMNVQQSKKDLAKVILAPHDAGAAETTLENLQKLRLLL